MKTDKHVLRCIAVVLAAHRCNGFVPENAGARREINDLVIHDVLMEVDGGWILTNRGRRAAEQMNTLWQRLRQ